MNSFQLSQSPDGSVWAKEFMRIFGDDCLPKIDEGLMISWFSNAIMCGHDWAYRKMEPSIVSKEIAARVWCDQEMSHVVMDAEAVMDIAKIIHRVRENSVAKPIELNIGMCNALGLGGWDDCIEAIKAGARIDKSACVYCRKKLEGENK